MKTLSDINNWRDAINQVVNCDCLDLMKLIPDNAIDLCLTDPPYREESENQPTKDMRNNGGMKNFGGKFTEGQWKEILRISKNQIIFGINNFGFMPEYKGFIVYKKKTISKEFTMSMAEIAFLSEGLGTVSKVYEHFPQEKNRKHPTQKPIELFREILVDYSKEIDLVIDVFAGSFTTARACKDLGRNWIGCEKEPKYCEIGIERLRQELLF